MELPAAESYKIRMIEPIYRSTRAEREQWLKESMYNLFLMKSEHVYIDMLSDSGTGAMSVKQWSEMMLGDESYAGAKSFEKLKASVKKICGFDHILPVHQGRGGENVLFSCLIKEGDIIPGNDHFVTTMGHIEYRKATAMPCLIDEAQDVNVYHPFKGNINIKKLKEILTEHSNNRIPFIIITVTSNITGGQPVSMENIEEVSALVKSYRIPICYDACRFAENAYFIKIRESGYEDWTIKDIVKKMFSFADMIIFSGKKDGYVNIGGFIGFHDEKLCTKAYPKCLLFEGHITYGGLSGRDMNALAQGIDEATEFECLDTRIKQVEYLAAQLDKYCLPFLKPVGGSAIFIDAGKFFNKVPKSEYQAQVLCNELYLEAGVRGLECGSVLTDRDPITNQNITPKMELIRLSIPRRTYTNNHMDLVAVALKNVFDRKDEICRGYGIIWESTFLRICTARLKKL